MPTIKDYEISQTMRQRRRFTITVTVIAVLISTFFFILMQLRVSHMHVVFSFVAGISFLILTYMALWTISADKRYSKLAKALKCCYFVCLAIGIACFIVLQVMIFSGATTDESAEVDVMIVLGAGLINNNPSLILVSRLNAAVAYLQTRSDIPVVVAGGLGQGQMITEAEAMARYLMARGIDESRIWKEEASTNTHENINFVIEIMAENGMNVDNINVAIVTNEFHLYRAKLVAEKAGLNAFGVAAETPGLHRKVIYFFRETFSLANELLFR